MRHLWLTPSLRARRVKAPGPFFRRSTRLSVKRLEVETTTHAFFQKRRKISPISNQELISSRASYALGRIKKIGLRDGFKRFIRWRCAGRLDGQHEGFPGPRWLGPFSDAPKVSSAGRICAGVTGSGPTPRHGGRSQDVCSAQDDRGNDARRQLRLAGLSRPVIATRRSGRRPSQAIESYGVHSAGSPALRRQHSALDRARAQDRRIPRHGTVSCSIRPAGPPAIGVIKGLVRSERPYRDGRARATPASRKAPAPRPTTSTLFRHLNIDDCRKQARRGSARRTRRTASWW